MDSPAADSLSVVHRLAQALVANGKISDADWSGVVRDARDAAPTNASLIGMLPDADLLTAYERTSGETDNPEADALLAEIQRRSLDT